MKWSSINHNHLPSILFLIMSILLATLVLNDTVRNEKYSNTYMPVLQVLGGIWCYPLICTVCHRVALGDQCATLSRAEYSVSVSAPDRPRGHRGSAVAAELALRMVRQTVYRSCEFRN